MHARCTAGSSGHVIVCVVLAASLMLTSVDVRAQFAAPVPPGVSSTVFMIQATNESGTGSYVASFDDGVWNPDDQTFDWVLTAPLDLVDEDTGQWVAALWEATIFVRATQVGEIELNVALYSGESLTTFVIGSPLMTFSSTIPASYARGRATASLTVSDGLGDGATVTGLGPTGTGAYRAYYNGYLAEGTRFSHLVGLISVGPFGTATGSQSDPLVGYRPVGEDIMDMSSEVAFTLTPYDLASAMTYAGFPEPEPCVGDANGDGIIDSGDLGLLLACFGSCVGDPCFDPAVDLVEDGCVNIQDLTVLLSIYGQSCW